MPLQFIPAIHRITHQIGLTIADADLDVSQGEAHILAHLASEGSCTIAELHRALAHKRSTLTSILDRLADKKWIVRRTSETDRRSFVVDLTAAGKTRAREVLKRLEAFERRMDKGLSESERAQFADLLGRIEAAGRH